MCNLVRPLLLLLAPPPRVSHDHVTAFNWCHPSPTGNPGAEEWSQWSSCSVTCGQGSQVRTRTCISPYGSHCSGPLRESRVCNNTAPCPGSVSHRHWTVLQNLYFPSFRARQLLSLFVYLLSLLHITVIMLNVLLWLFSLLLVIFVSALIFPVVCLVIHLIMCWFYVAPSVFSFFCHSFHVPLLNVWFSWAFYTIPTRALIKHKAKLVRRVFVGASRRKM